MNRPAHSLFFAIVVGLTAAAGLSACSDAELSTGDAESDALVGQSGDSEGAGATGAGGDRPDPLRPPGSGGGAAGGMGSGVDVGQASPEPGEDLGLEGPMGGAPVGPGPDAGAPPTMPPAPDTEPPPSEPEGDPCACAFGNGRYCAAAARDLEAERGCAVPVAHEQPDALLRCADAQWSVEQACPAACDRRPPGEDDRCLPQPGVDDGVWRLPWRCGDAFRCTQGNGGDVCGGGVGGHTGRQNFAFDFGMPRGTPVVAARAGEVIFSDNLVSAGQDCFDGCETNDCCNRCINTGNRVVLRHADGTTSLYLHLDRATAAVGSMVGSGAELGVSGTSGCAFGAHLHFQVQQNCGIWFCDSVGIDFTEDADMACGHQSASGNCP